MFCWGHYDPKSAAGFLTEIPAIDEELLNKVEQQIDDDGVKATVFGPIAGRPYKIYAVYAGAKDISFPIRPRPISLNLQLDFFNNRGRRTLYSGTVKHLRFL